MNASLLRPRRLLVLIVAIVASAATIPAAAAQTVGAPYWIGWGLTVDFPNNQLEAMYTVYVGAENPTRVIAASVPRSIAGQCDTTGTLQFDAGYAVFDGNTHITCEIPSLSAEFAALMPDLDPLPDDHCWCQAGGGPLFAAADVRLDAVTSQHPVFHSRQLGVNWSLPSTSVTPGTANAWSRVQLSSGVYGSPSWPVESAGNRVLSGQHGRAIVAVATTFNWLSFLDSSWQSYFASDVVGQRMGHWTEDPLVGTVTSADRFRLGTQRALLHIGYNPQTNAHFRGALRSAVFDPGCQPTS